MWPKTKAAYAGDEYVVKIRDKEIRTALTSTSLSGTKIRKVALPAFEDDGEILRWQLRENVPGSFPVHGGRVRVQARERGPDADVRRRRRRVPHEQALPPAGRRHAGEAALHRVRFGHALRQRPRPAAGHLRQGRQLRRVDRDARRHEGAVLGLRPLRSRDVGVDDDQRAGADDPRDVRQHGDRPAARQVRHGQRPRAHRRRGGQDPRLDADVGARHGAGRHPEGRPGAEHLHLLDRVLAQGDGRHPGVFRPSRHPQFLFGVDLRLPHRRGRRESDLAARVHAVERLHVRRGVSRARDAHRRLRAEPVVLLQLRHGSGVLGHRARRAADLGGGDEEPLRRATSARRSSSSTRRRRAAACTRRRSRSTTSGRRCRR